MYKQKPPLFFKTSIKGYKKDSPDINEPKLKIPSGNITMKGVEFPVHGKDNLGNEKMMKPGKNYEFPGDYVIETPLRQDCDEGFKGSCKSTRKQKRKSNRLRRRKKGTDFKSQVGKATDFVGLTDRKSDGTIVSRTIDKIKDKKPQTRGKPPEGMKPNPSWDPNCGCAKFVSNIDQSNPRELNDPLATWREGW